MTCLYIVPCKYIENASNIFECVKSIKEYHKDAHIAVVDACSENVTYLQDLSSTVEHVFSGNENYADGALWTVYKKLKNDYDYFVLLQDSIVLKKSLSPWINDQVTSLCWFPADEEHPRDTRMLSLLKQFTGLVPPLAGWPGAFGPILFFPKLALDQAYDLGVHNLLPICKVDNNSMERVWGIILQHLGYDIMTNSIEGRFTKTFKHVDKFFYERL